jgi:gluconate 5-dehydrogenase
MSGAIMEQGKDYFLSQTPLKRFGSEADLKGAAVFLASAASNYITGDILTVDGGVHAM